MIREFGAFVTLFQQGKEITNAKAWKNGQMTANLVGLLGALLVIAGGFGYDIHIDEAVLQSLAAGIVAAYCVLNTVLSVITSKKVGLPSKGDPTSGPE